MKIFFILKIKFFKTYYDILLILNFYFFKERKNILKIKKSFLKKNYFKFH